MKKLTLVTIVIVLIITAAALSCSQASVSSRTATIPVPTAAPAPKAPTMGYDTVTTSTSEERRIVRTGNMQLVVKDVADTRSEIGKIATSLGGYVVSSLISGDEDNIRGTISVRVPDDKFEQAISQFRSLAVRVKSENTTSQDVTEEYIDLKSRLGNAEATEKQYISLLNKATTVDEILKIYDSLSRVRSEIEQLKGRIQYLERVTSMSLITVNLEPETLTKPLTPTGWNALETFKSAIRGIVTFAQVLGTIAIWLLIFIPVWGSVTAIIIWRRRRAKKNKA